MDDKIKEFRQEIREKLAGDKPDIPGLLSGLLISARESVSRHELREAAVLELESTESKTEKHLLHLLLSRVDIMMFNFASSRENISAVLNDSNLEEEIHGRALAYMGEVCLHEVDLVGAEAHAKQALGVMGEGDYDFSRYILNLMGRIYCDHGRYYLAIEYFEAFRKAAELAKHEAQTANAISNLAIAYGEVGRFAEAEKCMFESLEYARKSGSRYREGLALSSLTSFFSNMEQFGRAREFGEESLRIAVEQEDIGSQAIRSINLASCYDGLKEYEKALGLTKRAKEICEEHNLKEILPHAYVARAQTLRMAEDPEALFMASKAIKFYEEHWPGKQPQNYEVALLEYGRLILERGDNEGAEYVWRALEILKDRPLSPANRRSILEAEDIIRNLPAGTELRGKGQVEVGQETLKRILEISKAISSENELPEALAKVLEVALEVSGAERGLIWMLEDDKLKFANSRNFPRIISDEPGYETIVEISRRTATMGVEHIASTPEEFAKITDGVKGIKMAPAKSVLVMPLSAGGNQTGAIYLDSRFAYLSVAGDIKGLLNSILEQGAQIIDKLRRLEEQSKQSRRLRREVKQKGEELRETLNIVERQKEELENRHAFSNIIGKSLKMRKVIERARMAAKTDLPVLIGGESGTGKELFARALHYGGIRSDNFFVPINCASIPENLLEAELFGYEEGAFTGANRAKEGLFEIANGGTLLLDEIGDMSEKMQAKLLRVLQENEIRRIGGRKTIQVDVRVLAASNRNIQEMVKAGTFREDLFYRINVITLVLPSLRERQEDIPLLVNYFWRKIAGDPDKTPSAVKREFLRVLEIYDWPGNVRELENEIEKVLALGDGTMNVELLSDNVIRGTSEAPLSLGAGGDGGLNLQAMELRLIRTALERAKGNKAKAARLLGIAKTSFYSKIKRYMIETE
ncbi:MAG: sigma 54-interacting transcriptional regulator [Planctomycetota bacterium]